jgi:hypothetical protein
MSRRRYFNANLGGDASWGNCAHSTLLTPGAFARAPLCDRLPRLDFGPTGVRRVSFIYGASGDWMDDRHAKALQDGRLPFEVAHVAAAGHNLMADNPVGFAEAVAASGGGSFDGVTFGNEAVRLDMAFRREEATARDGVDASAARGG